MLALVLALCVPDPSLLGDPDWRTREVVEWALRVRGRSVWPKLLPLAQSEDPEVRARVHRLLQPHREYWLEHRAWELLHGWEPTTQEFSVFFHDEQMRARVHRLATSEGCPDDWSTKWLLPENDYCDWFGHAAYYSCREALDFCRIRLGTHSPWPFR